MKILFLSFLPGRLANKLICLCHWQALVRPYGYALVPCDFSFERCFVGTRKHWFSRHLLLRSLAQKVEQVEIPREKGPQAQLLITRALQSGRSVTIGLQDWLPAPLRNCPLDEAKTRRYFTPVRRYRHAAQTATTRARQGSAPLVGVHIRHGDFAEFEGGRYFVDLETVVRNMHRFRAMAGEATFLVCSDAAFSPDDFPGLSVNFGPGHPISDITALAMCDFLLKPAASTFSLWSSWWGQTPCLTLQKQPDFVLSDFQVPPLDPFFDCT